MTYPQFFAGYTFHAITVSLIVIIFLYTLFFNHHIFVIFFFNF